MTRLWHVTWGPVVDMIVAAETEEEARRVGFEYRREALSDSFGLDSEADMSMAGEVTGEAGVRNAGYDMSSPPYGLEAKDSRSVGDILDETVGDREARLVAEKMKKSQRLLPL